jgi:hypothetical protein
MNLVLASSKLLDVIVFYQKLVALQQEGLYFFAKGLGPPNGLLFKRESG